MQSTLSLTLDLTQKKGFFTDTTDYSAISVDLNALGATGSVAIYFQGDSIGSPLTIDLAGGDTTTPLFDLELDLNGDVANGSYSAVYTVDFDFSNTTALATPNQIVFASIGENYQGFTAGAEIEVSVDLPGGASIVSAEDISGNLYVTIDESVSATFPSLRTVNVTQTFSGFSWVYSGCTQVSADVNFVYDCEYGDSGTWSVANTTTLGSNEIVSSLSCVVSYPSWTAVDQSFNPQVVITSLPYPTTPSLTPLATGTYTVSLSQQIQQNQASGLIVVYNNSVIKEFTVTCAGALCGLVPCIENLRAAHATELTRNRISKYQVFVDNVLLYYTEAMNYRSCGELDKYKETIALLQAQLDASGCECACCDDETYYWVSNNSATSVIDELLANFQYRLFSTGMGDPGSAQPDVEFGAIWQNTNTGVLYRCTNATPTALVWEEYYNPATASSIGAANGLSVSATDIVLGGSLNAATTIDLNTRNLAFSGTSGSLTFSGTTGNVVVSSTIGTALDVTGTSNAMSVEGTTNALKVLATTNTAATLQVDRSTNNDVAKNLVLSTTVTGSGVGANGLGSSIEFVAEGSSTSIPFTTSSIESVVTNAASQRGKLNFNVKAGSLVNTFTLNPDASVTLPFYGDGSYTGTATRSLSVDTDGNVIETTHIAGADNGLSLSSGNVVLGGSLDAATTIDLSTQDLTFSDGNVLFSGTGTQKVTLSSTSNTLQVTGGVGAVSIDGTTNALDATSTTNTAARLTVNTTTNNAAATNLSLRTTVDGGSGDDGVGSSIQFATESSAGTPVTTASIESVLVSATSPVQANLNFKTRSSSSSSLLDRLTLNSDGSATLPSYGGGTITGTPTHSLSVDSSGNVIETTLVPKLFVAKITSPSLGVYNFTEMVNTTGGTISMTYNGTAYTIVSSNSAFTVDKTFITATLEINTPAIFTAFHVSASQILANTQTTTSTELNGLPNALIKIEIYP